MNLTEKLTHKNYYYQVLDGIIKKNKTLTDVSKDAMFSIDIEHNWSVPSLQLVPKDGGKFREVYSFKQLDKYYLKVINSILCDNVGINDFVFSYRKGRCIRDAAYHLQYVFSKGCFFVAKFDLKDYFGSVNRTTIFNAIDNIIEDAEGRDLLYRFFSLDSYEFNNEIYFKYLSLVQGSPLSSFMSNYILKDIDDFMCNRCVCYSRYSDDIIIVEETRDDLESSVSVLQSMLGKLSLELNSTKTRFYDNPMYIDYLGLRISKDKISLTDNRRHNVKSRIRSVIDNIKTNKPCSIYKQLYKRLYFNEGSFSKYSGALSFILMNVTETKDILDLDFYIKDTIRAKLTGKYNKANSRRYPNSWFSKTGYISAMTFYNMYRVSPNLMKQFIHNICKSNYINSTPLLKSTDDTRVVGTTDFFVACSNAHKGSFLLGDFVIDKDSLHFDIVNKLVLANDKIIVDGIKVHKDLKFITNGGCYSVNRLGNLTVDTKSLVNMFLIASIKDFYRDNRFTHCNDFILHSFKDICCSLKVKQKYIEVPRRDRVFLFMYNLYAFVIFNSKEWRHFDNLIFMDIRSNGKGFTVVGGNN